MILVTGATGCIGSNLTRALVRRGEEVAVFRRAEDDLEALGEVSPHVEHHIGDIRDRDAVARALAGVDACYHVAGFAVPVNRFAKEMYEVNVVGTENVMLEAARREVRVVHTSSVSAVGFPTDAPADETFRFNGHGHAYAVTKRLAEQVVIRHVDDGLEAVLVNPAATIAGGGNRRNGWAALVMRLQRGRLRAFPAGGLSVATKGDVIDAHLAAMEKGTIGERYIVSSADLSYGSLLSRIAEVVGVRAPRLRLPNAVVGLAALGASAVAPLTTDPLKRPLLTRENARLLTKAIFYDPAKARRELGLVSGPLRPALRELAAWCEQKGRFG